jgi:sugar/nucleoside kinase (ribokinase family)
LLLPTSSDLLLPASSDLLLPTSSDTTVITLTMSNNVTFHIVGDAYVDFFCFLDGDWPEHGGDSRLSQPVKSYAGGSSVNTATHLKALSDNSVVLHTVLNPSDHYGQLLVEHTEKHGFPLVNCAKPDDDKVKQSTGHCIAIVSGGERSFMTHQGCVDTFHASDLHTQQIIDTPGPVHLHVAGYFNVTGFWNGNLKEQIVKIVEERLPQKTTVSLVTQHDATKGWDGGIDDVIRHLDFLIMNELEADRILQRGGSGDDDWVSYFSNINPKALIIITKGANGAIVFRDQQIIATLNPAITVDAIDPTGAGDSFTAGFLHKLWERSDTEWTQEVIQDALYLGCAAGTAAVTIRGASIPCDPKVIADLYEKQKAKAQA